MNGAVWASFHCPARGGGGQERISAVATDTKAHGVAFQCEWFYPTHLIPKNTVRPGMGSRRIVWSYLQKILSRDENRKPLNDHIAEPGP